MGYCSIAIMQAILPKTITIGETNVTSPTLERPSAGSNTIDTLTAQRYIDLATQEIDSRLSPVYLVPLQRIKIVEVELIANVQAGASSVLVYDNVSFNTSALVRITDSAGTELIEVGRMPSGITEIHTVNFVTKTQNSYRVSRSAKASVIEFPDPIPATCARIAVSMIIDRQFVAEQSPDVSSYGKNQRNMAGAAIEDIVAGVIRLNGQRHMGRRFARTSIRDTHSSTGEAEKGRWKMGQE